MLFVVFVVVLCCVLLFAAAVVPTRVMYKKQYEKFKMVNVVCMFILSVVALVFSNYA